MTSGRAKLAIDGGDPVRTTPVPGWPAPGDREIAAVCAVLESGRLNYWTGSEGRSFESEYAARLGRTHAISVANGTLALELALRAFEIGPGDEVIVPSRTFIATAGAVVAIGATPVVADIEAESGCITRQTVEPAVNEKTRAIIPVHLGGWPVDMDPILDLASASGVVVIEDCAQAHAGAYRGRPVGATGTHAAAFSFCQDKILPVGEGGMLLLDNEAAYERAWGYKEHGKSLRKLNEVAAGHSKAEFKWLVESFGSNWRMDEMSAAVGRVGLARLDEWHAARQTNAERIARGLSGMPGLRIPLPAEEFEHAFYRLYSLVVQDELLPGWDRNRIAASILAEGVPCQYGTCAEIYREAAFSSAGLGPATRLPGAAQAHDASLAFFVHPTLTEGDIDDVIAAVRKVMEAATR